MEAFTLLKHWKGGGGVAPGSGGVDSGSGTRATTVNVAAVANNLVETDDEDGEGGDDDGPFFDLEFAVPEEEEEEGEDKDEEEELDGFATDTDNENDGDGTTTEGERELNFMLSSSSSNDRTDANLELSPSDDLLFKGKLVPVESSSINVFSGSEPNSKPQFAVSLLKSATKFRVFMLQFKKSKMSPPPTTQSDQKQKQEEKEEVASNKKLLTVKFKVEEVPIVSLFNSKTSNKSQKQSTAEESVTNATPTTEAAVNAAASDDKFFSKDVMQKYLKKVKPLYIRVSKRYGEKLRLSGQLSLGSGVTQKSSPPKSTAAVAEKGQKETESSVESPSTSTGKGGQKQGNLQAGLRVVSKHLGKSRSASSAIVAPPAGPVQSRRDDSLLQQQDGIQSAILHCKRSFNASRECESGLLSRSVSDPSYDEKGGKIDV